MNFQLILYCSLILKPFKIPYLYKTYGSRERVSPPLGKGNGNTNNIFVEIESFTPTLLVFSTIGGGGGEWSIVVSDWPPTCMLTSLIVPYDIPLLPAYEEHSLLVAVNL